MDRKTEKYLEVLDSATAYCSHCGQANNAKEAFKNYLRNEEKDLEMTCWICGEKFMVYENKKLKVNWVETLDL